MKFKIEYVEPRVTEAYRNVLKILLGRTAREESFTASADVVQKATADDAFGNRAKRRVNGGGRITLTGIQAISVTSHSICAYVQSGIRQNGVLSDRKRLGFECGPAQG